MHKNLILNLKKVCDTTKITYDLNSPTSQTNQGNQKKFHQQ